MSPRAYWATVIGLALTVGLLSGAIALALPGILAIPIAILLGLATWPLSAHLADLTDWDDEP